MPSGLATPRRSERGRASDAAAAILVLLGCLAIAREARGLVFSGDDWAFVLDRRGWDPGVFLRPHGEHLSALPILAYKGLLELFGAGSYAPFMALALLVHATACVLLYALARRRVGPWAALAPAAVLVLLGPAWQDLLWAFQVGYLGSVAAGLGAALCLERDDRRGDVAAAALLAVALLCSSVGVAMLVLAAVLVLLSPPRRWRRLWVAGLPLALDGAWYAGYGVSGFHGENVDAIPEYLARALSAALASVTGLAQTDRSPYLVSTTYGRFVAVGVVVLLAVHVVRRRALPASTWAAIAAAVALWLAQSLAFFAGGREAEQSRYQYTGRAGAAGRRLARAGLAADAALRRDPRRGDDPRGRCEHGDAARPGGVLEDQQRIRGRRDRGDRDRPRGGRPGLRARGRLHRGGHRRPHVALSAGPYLSAVDAFGSPADSPREILRRPEPVRQAADVVLAHAERLSARVRKGGSRCGTAFASEVAVEPGTLTVRTGPGAPAALYLRRFASGFRLVRFALPGDSTIRVALPRDRATVPWRARIAGGRNPRRC